MATKRTGQAPYGFLWSHQDLVLNRDEASVRKLMFDLFVQHRKKAKVARILNCEGYCTRRGSEWADVGVHRSLICPSAIGRYAINKTTTHESGQRFEKPKSEWDFVECKPIVPMELWNQVQSILKEQKSSPSSAPSKESIHTFAGFTYCDCGGSMAVPSNTPKYVCQNCRRKIPIADLEKLVRAELAEHLKMLDERLEVHLTTDPVVLADQRRIEVEIAGTKAKISRIDQLFLDGKISTSRFGELHEPLIKRLTELSDEEATSQSQLKQARDKYEASIEMIEDCLVVWDDLEIAGRRRIASKFVHRLTIGEQSFDVSYKLDTRSSLEVADAQQTENPTNEAQLAAGEPLYIPLPKAGEVCPWSGLKRSMLNSLILRTERNGYNPPVKSAAPKGNPKAGRGARLIHWPSLKAYLKSQES